MQQKPKIGDSIRHVFTDVANSYYVDRKRPLLEIAGWLGVSFLGSASLFGLHHHATDFVASLSPENMKDSVRASLPVIKEGAEIFAIGLAFTLFETNRRRGRNARLELGNPDVALD